MYKENMLWSSLNHTPDVINTIEYRRIENKENNQILDLGCGEGRDAIYLLSNGYNVLAVDYSNNVIKKCNELSKNKFIDKFRKLDLITDKLDLTFDFIYSVAVLHMFVLEKHRNQYFKFLKEHLKEKGKVLICVLGDGSQEYISDVKDAYKNSKRTVLNTMVDVNIVVTTCRIVNWTTLEKEIIENGFEIEKKWVSEDIPEFDKSMCVIISKKI